MVTGTAPQPSAQPGQEDDDLGGNWFSNNWKGLLAAVAGFLMLAMSGGEMLLMILGALILAAGAVALMKPELYDRAGDMMGGLWNRGVQEVSETVERFRVPVREKDLSKEDLTTPEGQKTQLSEAEKKFEEWAISDDILAKLDQKDRENLLKILKKMRDGNPGEQVNLDAQDVAGFVDGLNDNNLPQQEKDKLKRDASDQLSTFR